MTDYIVADCFDVESPSYGDESTRISDIIEKYLDQDEGLYLINLDGAKPGSQIQRCIDRFPDRVVNSGIAEQNMIGVAAGIALNNQKVICMSYGPFVVLRAMEQIYMDVAYNHAPVCIIITGTGLSGGEGPTHNVVQDIAMLRCIPDMTVVSPCDPNETKWAIESYMNNPRPMYIRCGKANMPLLYEKKPLDFKITMPVLLKEGKGITIFSTGNFSYIAYKAVCRLEKKGIYVRLINVHTLAPFDKEIVIDASIDSSVFITIEEHSIIGGLGSVISEVIACDRLNVKVIRMGISNEFSPEGTADSLYEYYGLTVDGIINLVMNYI